MFNTSLVSFLNNAVLACSKESLYVCVFVYRLGSGCLVPSVSTALNVYTAASEVVPLLL